MRKKHPYLTRKRFPSDWACVELVKQYLRNNRKHEAKKARRERERQSRLSEDGRGSREVLSGSDRARSPANDSEDEEATTSE